MLFKLIFGSPAKTGNAHGSCEICEGDGLRSSWNILCGLCMFSISFGSLRMVYIKKWIYVHVCIYIYIYICMYIYMCVKTLAFIEHIVKLSKSPWQKKEKRSTRKVKSPERSLLVRTCSDNPAIRGFNAHHRRQPVALQDGRALLAQENGLNNAQKKALSK